MIILFRRVSDEGGGGIEVKQVEDGKVTVKQLREAEFVFRVGTIFSGKALITCEILKQRYPLTMCDTNEMMDYCFGKD